MLKFIVVALTVAPLSCFAGDFQEASSAYQTQEFSTDGSGIPKLFLCAHAGRETGSMPKAKLLLEEMLVARGHTKSQMEFWTNDATVMTGRELRGVVLDELWQNECKRNFDRIHAIFGSD